MDAIEKNGKMPARAGASGAKRGTQPPKSRRPLPLDSVVVFDTTLRDGEQRRENYTLQPRGKAEFVRFVIE